MNKKFWKKLKEYNKIANIAEIGRRYFVMNSYDGILTILGILIGTFIANVKEPGIVISTGFATSIAMAVSGCWGTYLTEEAERKKKLKDLAKHTLRDLRGTKIGKAEKAASIIVSIIDGLAPFLSAFIVILPFFFVGLLGIDMAYLIAVILAFILLILLGGFLGHISKESVVIDALKMVFAGLICIGLILVLRVPV